MAENNTAEAKEPIKKAKAYKVTSKAFAKRREAAGEAAEAKTKGIMPVLIIEGNVYKVFYATEPTKAAAEKLLKAVKDAGLSAEIKELEQ